MHYSNRAKVGSQRNGLALSRGPQPVRAILLMANLLDCQSMAQMFAQRQGVELLDVTDQLEVALENCRRWSPDILVVDPKALPNLFQQVDELVRSKSFCQVMLLEDRIHEGRLSAVLALPGVSYFTRKSSFEAIYAAIREVVAKRQRIFDPHIAERVTLTPQGWRLNPPHEGPSVATLTNREREIMQLIVEGSTVRSCAQQLRLAESTVDNHKSRLMKKLKVRKIAQLTQVAIRDGLISV